MIDTHAHLDGEVYADDISEVLDRAFGNGIEKIIIPAIEKKAFKGLLELTERDQRLFCGIGIHPHHANEADETAMKKVEELSSGKKVVAIGEIGLDYYYDFAPKEVQKNVFREQLKIAKRRNLPAIIHNREADDDIMNILRAEQNGSLKGVLHCFSSPVETMRMAIELGFNISFTGNITFKRTELGEIVKETPLDKILLETDSPYMTPVPNRGKRNEPVYVRLVAEKIAEIKSISINEVISMTTQNAKNLFRLLLVTAFIVFFVSIANAQYENADNKQNQDSLYHPYEKFIGLGPFVGVNTIVTSSTRTVTNETRDVSYEGIAIYGGNLSYSIFDFLMAELDYGYSLNSKKLKNVNDPLHHDGPNEHQFIEVRTLWLINPYSAINFFGSFGYTYIYSIYQKGAKDGFETKIGTNAINCGIGFNFNANLRSWGLLNVMAEWVLNFELKKRNTRDEEFWNPKTQKPEIIPNTAGTINTFYSTPRLTLIWYPPIMEMFRKK